MSSGNPQNTMANLALQNMAISNGNSLFLKSQALLVEPSINQVPDVETKAQ